MTTDLHLALEQDVRLVTKVLPDIHAKIRWRRSPQYGLIFEEVFKLDRLAAYLGPADHERQPR